MKISTWRFRLRSGMVVVALLSLVTAGARTLLPDSPTPRIPEGARLLVPAVPGMRTLVGYKHDTPPPWSGGNCFELSPRARGRRTPPQGLHVINMHCENFEEVVKRLDLKTVEVEHVGGYFLVVDPRIPRRWLRERPCTTCVTATISEAVRSKHADKFREPAPGP